MSLVYVSIDLETTGLDRRRHQIIEIGAVAQEATGKELGRFHAVIQRDSLYGDSFALNMHRELIGILARGGGEQPEHAFGMFRNWLHGFAHDEAVTAAGKNFEAFDRRFLDNEKHFPSDKTFHRRVLDPASMYALPSDTQPPCLADCLKRAGMSSTVTHGALDDALQVRDLIEYYFKQHPCGKAALDMLFLELKTLGAPEGVVFSLETVNDYLQKARD